MFAEKIQKINGCNFENRSNMNFLNKINILLGTGLFQDFQRISERARIDSIAFRENFSSILKGRILASRIASLLNLHTRFWHLRPICCSLFLGSLSSSIAELHLISYTGHSFRCFSGSLGDKSDIFKIMIEQFSGDSISCRESFSKIFKIFKKTKKSFNHNLLEIICFSNKSSYSHFPISSNIILEIDRKTKTQ